jgi:hypothetical protein
MRWVVAAGIALAMLGFALPGESQQQQDCDLEVLRTPGSMGEMVTLPDGEVRIDQWGGVEAVCGDRRLRADSASYFQNSGVLFLVGHLVYTDSERRLEAERGTYYEEQALMRAEGNVRLTDNDGRSTLTGPVLDYFPANENRPVERMFAPQRPHLTFYPDEPDAPGSLPFDVDADRLHIYGDSLLAGAGDVVAVRGELTARGDSMDLALKDDRLLLLGEPFVTAGDMELSGDTVLAIMEERKIREIQAWPDASAHGAELSLEAPLLRLFVTGDEIDRVVAAAGDSARTGAIDEPERAPWARSESRDYTLVADSIDILRPGGQLERVVAVDRALAVSRDELIPGGGLLFSDWLEGDTITGFFEIPPVAPGAAEQNIEPQLRRLVATGPAGEARALYHLREESSQEESAGNPAVNYVKGNEVMLVLEAGEVTAARVVGPARGVYLEPIPPSPEDTTGADSLTEAASGAVGDSARAATDTTGRARRDTIPGGGEG